MYPSTNCGTRYKYYILPQHLAMMGHFLQSVADETLFSVIISNMVTQYTPFTLIDDLNEVKYFKIHYLY